MAGELIDLETIGEFINSVSKRADLSPEKSVKYLKDFANATKHLMSAMAYAHLMDIIQIWEKENEGVKIDDEDVNTF